MKKSKIGIVGTGVAAKFIALFLLRRGHYVTLFDYDGSYCFEKKVPYLGLGKIDAYTSMEHMPEPIYSMADQSYPLWKETLSFLGGGFFCKDHGSLVVTADPENETFGRLIKKSRDYILPETKFQILDKQNISLMEPSLTSIVQKAIYFKESIQVDGTELSSVLENTLKSIGVVWKSNIRVHDIQQKNVLYKPYQGGTQYWRESFDWVIECNNYYGAEKEIEEVKTEIVEIYAPNVTINRPIRYTRFNYPLYILPRSKNRFIVEATYDGEKNAHEENFKIRSFLELLSSLCQISPGFAEGEIVKSSVVPVPSLKESIPKASFSNNHLLIEGLSRYGFLIMPQISEMVCHMIEKDEISDQFTEFFL